MTNPTVMAELKASTQQMHDQTEEGAFNQELVKGRIPLETFVDSLEQMYLIHVALESRLAAHRESIPAFRRVLRDYQMQAPYLEQDLAHFGRDLSAAAPLEPTLKLIGMIERLSEERPTSLLGVHYVFEGSNNGSRFMARALRRAYGLSGEAGLKYYDPYGDRQMANWQAFKADMDSVGFAANEISSMCKAAVETFAAVKSLHAALYTCVAGAATA